MKQRPHVPFIEIELETVIEPFKGLLLGLFFIAVGASIDFNLITSEPIMIGELVAVPGRPVDPPEVTDPRGEVTRPTETSATTGDIVSVVRFLLSPAAGFVTGQTLVVDGGLTC